MKPSHSCIHPKQDPRKDHHLVAKWCSTPAAEEGTSGLLEGWKMHRPDRHTVEHHRAVHWIADSSNSTLWTWRRQSIASTGTVFGAYPVHMEYHKKFSPRQELLQQFHMQSRKQRQQFASEDWSEVRLCDVQHHHWLGDATNNGRSDERTVLTLNLKTWTDDLAVVSYTHQHIKEKTSRLNTYAQQIGLKISQKKTEVMTLNIPNPVPVQVNGDNVPTTDEFFLLSSIVRCDEGASTNVQNRLCQARNASRMLNDVWRSQQYSTKTKLKLYQLCTFYPVIRLKSAGGWLPVTLMSASFSTHRACEESSESSGPTPPQMNKCLLVVIMTAWKPSSRGEGGSGLGTYLGTKVVTSPAQPYTGYQKAHLKTGVEDLRCCSTCQQA